MSALRQEGHAFTDMRFHAWFAGLVTLSDEPVRGARPPRMLCDTILAELSFSSLPPLADLATRIRPALLAPGEFGTYEDGVEARSAFADARRLLDELTVPFAPLPFEALATLHGAVSADMRFAPPEPTAASIPITGRPVAIREVIRPAPLWAVELLVGERFRAEGALPCFLPLPGLILRRTMEHPLDAEARRALADTLRSTTETIRALLQRALALADYLGANMPARRGTSRAPAVFELLAGFGPLRSAQIETVLGATRLGVRKMLASLATANVLSRVTISGGHLYDAGMADVPTPVAPGDANPALSRPAIDEYEASLAAIDRLLARGNPDCSPLD